MMTLWGELVMVVLIASVMNVGLEMVRAIVWERQSLQDGVRAEIGALWGSKQQVPGPFLSVPYGVAGGTPWHRTRNRRRGCLLVFPTNWELVLNLTLTSGAEAYLKPSCTPRSCTSRASLIRQLRSQLTKRWARRDKRACCCGTERPC